MKQLIIILILIPLFGYSQLPDTLDVKGNIHSIVYDQNRADDYYVVENGLKKAVIHYYRAKHLRNQFEFDDVIVHLFAKGRYLYITVSRTKRLLIYDKVSDELVKTLDGLYLVRHVSDNHVFAEYQSSNLATNKRYYIESGLVVFKDSSFDVEVKFPGTTIADVSNNYLLIDEKTNWGTRKEKSNIQLLEIATLKMENLYYRSMTGVIPANKVGISPDGRFIAILDNQLLLVFDRTNNNRRILTPDIPYDASIIFVNNFVLGYVGTEGIQKYYGLINIGNVKSAMVELVSNTIRSKYLGKIGMVRNGLGEIIVYCLTSNIIFFI